MYQVPGTGLALCKGVAGFSSEAQGGREEDLTSRKEMVKISKRTLRTLERLAAMSLPELRDHLEEHVRRTEGMVRATEGMMAQKRQILEEIIRRDS